MKKAAQVRAAKVSAVAQAERMVARAGVDVSPIEHLLESLHRAAALVEVWGSMVAGLDAKAQEEYADPDGEIPAGEPRGSMAYVVIGGETFSEQVAKPMDRLVTVDNKGSAQIHPFVTEYNNAIDRRAKFAKLCLDAGIAERQVRLAEEQGQLIAKVIRGILTDLGVADRKEVPTIVRKHLQLVAG